MLSKGDTILLTPNLIKSFYYIIGNQIYDYSHYAQYIMFFRRESPFSGLRVGCRAVQGSLQVYHCVGRLRVAHRVSIGALCTTSVNVMLGGGYIYSPVEQTVQDHSKDIGAYPTENKLILTMVKYI